VNRTAARAAFLIVAGALAAGACSDPTATVSSGCVAGNTRRCDPDAGCQVAIQECTGSPPSWGPCHCVFSPAQDATPPPPEVDAGLPLVGNYCRSDRDCAAGSFCLGRASNSFFGGGPPKGVCVADCSVNPNVCSRFASATCVRIAPLVPATDASAAPDAAPDSGDAGRDANVPTDAKSTDANDGTTESGSEAGPPVTPDATADAHEGGVPSIADATTRDAPNVDDATTQDARSIPPVRVPTSLCMKSCTLGQGTAFKCYGVPSVACAPHPSGSGSEGFCRPLCASNADCATTTDGPPRVCNVRSGVCVNAPGNGDVNLGRTCNALTSIYCYGECIPLGGAGSATSICSHRCAIDAAVDCGESTNDAFDGACLEAPVGRGAGDVGYCRKLCDCPEDCGGADLVCVAFDNPDHQSGFKRSGVCTPDSLATGQRLKCN
jgi:hypothetical protein